MHRYTDTEINYRRLMQLINNNMENCKCNCNCKIKDRFERDVYFSAGDYLDVKKIMQSIMRNKEFIAQSYVNIKTYRDEIDEELDFVNELRKENEDLQSQLALL